MRDIVRFSVWQQNDQEKKGVPPLHIFELLLIFDNNAYALNWAMSFMLLLLKKKFIYVDSEWRGRKKEVDRNHNMASNNSCGVK